MITFRILLSLLISATPASGQYIIGANAGNTSFARNDTLFLRGADKVSAWAWAKRIKPQGNRIKIKVVKSSADCSFGLSPTLDPASATGIYGEANRLRYYAYGSPRKLHMQWRKSGATIAADIGLAGPDPFWLGMAFVADSIRFEHSTDGVMWRLVAAEKFVFDGYYTATDSFFLEFNAWSTPGHGEVIMTGLAVEQIGPPVPPVQVDTLGENIRVSWRANTEPDLAGYHVWWGKNSAQFDSSREVALPDTALSLHKIESGNIFFAVTAFDTAGNESNFSNIVQVYVVPREYSEYDINQDGETDVFDWLLLLRLIGTTAENPLYNRRADFTGDGEIDGFDMSLFSLLSGIF